MTVKRRLVAVMLAVVAASSSWSADACAQTCQQPVDRGSLLTWAHRITSAKGWNVWDYTWLSNDSILAFHKRDGTNAVDQAFEVDAHTGDQKPFDGFNEQLRKMSDIGSACDPVLSPDHRWIFAFHGGGPDTGFTKWLAIRLDGTQSVAGKVRGAGSFSGGVFGVWSQHSDEWLALYGYRGHLQATHYSIASPDLQQESPLANMGNTENYSPILGLTPAGDAIIDDLEGQRTGLVSLLSVDLQAGHRPTHTWNVRLPRGARANWTSVVLSPRSDRLAWLFYFDKPYRERRLTKQCRATYEIWISGLDGSEMHSVGYQPVKRENQQEGDVVLAPRWLPDGNHLSFIKSTWLGPAAPYAERYQRDLYTIPAE